MNSVLPFLDTSESLTGIPSSFLKSGPSIKSPETSSQMLQSTNSHREDNILPESDESTHSSVPSVPIRWLHLSDFHVGKDIYGQRQLFRYILEHIRDKIDNGLRPDIVFITGDIADKGQIKQYKTFFNEFLLPLFRLLSREAPIRIFLIPGNHDVDRSKARAVQRYDILLNIPEFLDPTEQGLLERKLLFPRFQAYARSEIHQLAEVGSQWLLSSDGAYSAEIDIRGHRLGILGLNTAWLSESENDEHRLTPGKNILETGLAAISNCNTRIVLGHHPIDWFLKEVIPPIRALLGKNNVIYLHGHLHKTSANQERGAGYPFLIMQSGASFQAHEDERWVNRLLWCELYPKEHYLKVEPRQWPKDNEEWSIDGMAFPEANRPQAVDYWVYQLS